MKGLFIKDLKLVATQKKFIFLAIVLSVFITLTGDDPTFTVTYIVLLLSMLTLNTISYDEMNGGMLFLLSLPVDRKMYVKEKYMFCFMNLVVAALASLLFSLGFIAFKNSEIEFTTVASSIAGVTLGMALMFGVTIPLVFKFGMEKGRIAMIVCILGIIGCGVGGYKVIADVLNIDISSFIVELLSKLPKPGEGLEIVVVLAMLLAMMLVLGISYIVSLRIMKKKEL
ncbi:MAG: ABC-2 transporter permease [Lachnospira sp.]|nr:ABC-2 transporter permease [Lachnospira sp.]